MKDRKEHISYSQCWEDPLLVNEALKINQEDIILSIMSGGDNSLSLLTQNPKKVISIDINRAQKYILELKIAAIKHLDHNELLKFLGIRKSNDRIVLLEKLENDLSEDTRKWVEENVILLEKGIIHIGKFERFLNVFSKYIIPLIHSKKTIQNLLSIKTIEEQKVFYNTIWNSKRWRLFFKMITSRFILENFARQKGMFNHTKIGEVSSKYINRVDHTMMNIPINNNYFIHYCLKGNYDSVLPHYLESDNIILIKNNLSHLKMVVNDLMSYLKSMPDNYFSKFNLSDVFEALSVEQNNLLWKEIIRTSKPNARIVYWNNLVNRSYPRALSSSVKNELDFANDLYLKDRVFFYGSFHVNTITK